MASAQDTLYELFVEIAGSRTPAVSPLTIAGQDLANVVKEVTSQITASAVPRGAVPPAASSVKADGFGESIGGGAIDVLETVGSSVFKNALGAAPLVRGLISLFGGGGSDAPEPPPLVKYSLPPALHFTAADTGAGIRGVDVDQQGLPRAQRLEVETTAASRRESQTQQVTVNVQAMDARSFLDRSTDIAAAVREAMLNLNSLNDVVGDL